MNPHPKESEAAKRVARAWAQLGRDHRLVQRAVRRFAPELAQSLDILVASAFILR